MSEKTVEMTWMYLYNPLLWQHFIPWLVNGNRLIGYLEDKTVLQKWPKNALQIDMLST